MITIRWKILGLNEPSNSLCVTCTWGLVRKGFRAAEAEAFCRLISPNALVPFAVSECTGYADRRAGETGALRRIGFITASIDGEDTIQILEPTTESATK